MSYTSRAIKMGSMKARYVIFLLMLLTGICSEVSAQSPRQNFEPTFASLEKVNPVPEWFKDAKFGIYFHWGVYSVPAFANEWYPRNMYLKGSSENRHHVETYGDPSQWPYDNFITGAKDKRGNHVQFAPKLKSEGGNFDPDEWAKLFADAGAKFAGPVAEHHDGFSMWASKANPWNAKDAGPRIDLVGLLADAIRKHDMKLILSMHHAYNITGFYDAVPKTGDAKLQMLYGQLGKEKNEALWLAKHKEIIDQYKPDIIWQDFNLPKISEPILLGFLSHYYNRAGEWNKEVVATYKDALNTRCAVLDYERGGPTDLTKNYWLTDDAISSSSWCYTEGIGYYSKKQILHGFLDRVSKNGNLLLNLSPKADGTIPQEQKDILLAMGQWLKKYGEAVYATRAWEKYGEGPTTMGAAHGVFTAPAEGTAKDVRYTRSKDNTTLFAIFLGWDKNQKKITLTSLSSERIDCKNLKSVELINGQAGKYLPLKFSQNTDGLTIDLPDGQPEELAYVLKLKFDGRISALDKYADFNTAPHYYLVPNDNHDDLVLGSDLTLKEKSKSAATHWKLEPVGKGLYRITSRENSKKVLTIDAAGASGPSLVVADAAGNENEVWKIESWYSGLYRISGKQSPSFTLSINGDIAQGSKASTNGDDERTVGWKLKEVCEKTQKAFHPNVIPGSIEAEDFDIGCPGEAYRDRDEGNITGKYRTGEDVDIEVCTAGGYDIGWTNKGEWMAYTVNVNTSSAYEVSFYVASGSGEGKLHLEFDGVDKTGVIAMPNTGGYQEWQAVRKRIQLGKGSHLMKLVIDNNGVNLDKVVFEQVK